MLPYTFHAPYFRSPPNRKEFFKAIAKRWDKDGWRYKKIEEAYALAHCLCGTRKRDNSEFVFDHMVAVTMLLVEYLNVADYREVIVALLHDSIEKYGVTFEYIEMRFGGYIARLVLTLAKPSAPTRIESEKRHHRGFNRQGPAYFRTKLADRLRNILTVDAHSRPRGLRKADESRKNHLVHARRHGILADELLEGIELIEQFHRRKLKAA